MRRRWPRRRRPDFTAEQAQADRLDRAVSARLRGEPVDDDRFGPELEAAEALAAAAATGLRAPHEPLVALRAGIEARRAAAGRWRRLVLSPAAPVLAVVVLALAAVAVFQAPVRQRIPREVVVERASSYLHNVDAQTHAVEQQVATGTPDPRAIQAAVAGARSEAAKVEAAASVLPQGDRRREQLLAAARQRIRQLENLLKGRSIPLILPINPVTGTVTTLTAALPSTTTTSVPRTTTTTGLPTTSTTAPSTTTTTVPRTTTTTVPNTTTTTPQLQDPGTGTT